MTLAFPGRSQPLLFFDKAMRVKYRGEQREGRLKAAKDAAYPQYKEHAIGKKCIHEVGKMIYRRLLAVV